MQNLKVGSTFKNKWVPEMDSTVVSINEAENELVVRLTPNDKAPSYRQPFQETWNLLHVLHGFNRGDYYGLNHPNI